MTYPVTIRVIETHETTLDINAKDEGEATKEGKRLFKSGAVCVFEMTRVDRQVEVFCDVVPEVA